MLISVHAKIVGDTSTPKEKIEKADHTGRRVAGIGPYGPVPIAGAAAGSGPCRDNHKPGGYALHEISADEDAFQVIVTHRCFDATGAIGETARDRFRLSRRC